MNIATLTQEIESQRLMCEKAHATLAALKPDEVQGNLTWWQRHLSVLEALRTDQYARGHYGDNPAWPLIHPCQDIVNALQRLLEAVSPESEVTVAQACDGLISDCPDTEPPPQDDCSTLSELRGATALEDAAT
jgi:hypothetical protein